MEIKNDDSCTYIEEVVGNLKYSTHPSKSIIVAQTLPNHISGKSKFLHRTPKGNFFTVEYNGNLINPKLIPITPAEAEQLWPSFKVTLNFAEVFGHEQEVEEA